MTIKHLVMSGGGPIGFSYLGAMEYLSDNGFVNMENIESIYATSIGAIISVMLSLKYDSQTIQKYVVERPWKDVFKISAKQIMESYTNKGIYDIKITEKTFKPLLEANDLSISITMKEFYEYSKKDIHFFVFDLNTFKTVEITHTEYPDLSLLKAIYMSCSIPGIFIPTIIDGKCLIDGGSLANYPLNYCLRDHPNKDEILGFNFVYKNEDGTECSGNNIINEESDLLDYVLAMSLNSVNYITTSIKYDNIENVIECCSSTTTLTIDSISHAVGSIEGRQDLYDKGIECGKRFLEAKEKRILHDDENKNQDEYDYCI
jgi:predicted acylesterase/phospholipase RssA